MKLLHRPLAAAPRVGQTAAAPAELRQRHGRAVVPLVAPELPWAISAWMGSWTG